MQRFTKNIAIITLVGLVGILLIACNGGSTAPNASETSATVNGQPILLSEVDNALNLQMHGQQNQLSPLELAQARLQILDTLIQKEVLLQRAKKENLVPTEDEINQEVNNQMQQSGMTQDKFNEQLKANNLTPVTFREETRKGLAIKKLQDKVTGAVQPPSDKEVTDFYEANKAQFVNPRGVSLAEISVNPDVVPGMQDDAKSEPEAKQKIDLVYQQLKAGADFATVARARSEDQYGTNGGDLGFATEQKLKETGFAADLIAKFFALEVGSFTEPVQVNNSWYIFKLQAKQLQAENVTLESPNVRQQIIDAIVNQRKQLLNAALLATVMNEARINNFLAEKMLANPNNLSGVRPAGAATPAPSATPAPAASPAASPATTTPAAKPSPAAAKPSPAAAKPAGK